MNGAIDDLDAGQPEKLSYYNYFTEVEQEFVRRRAAHMFISVLDWALIETWKNREIPLHIALRGINQAFDSWDAQPAGARKVNTIFYCEQAVEEAFAQHQLTRVGEATKPNNESRWARSQATFTRESLVEFVDQCRINLAQSLAKLDRGSAGPLIETFARALERLDQTVAELRSATPVDAEAIERDLDAIDRLLVEALRTASGGLLKGLRREATSQLREFKSKMEKTVYEQTVENYIARRLRELYLLPRLSLFYM